MKLTNDIRKSFLDYFKKHGHTIVKSSPLVPQNDPTLMFTNSGMVQFKNLFTGLEKRAYTRATTAQKCVRAGGKHNDLENVGYTARHHTFFEMLGNFSFSDYFKEEAIHFAWNFLTKDAGISKDKLCVTVYSEDKEAAHIWKRLTGFPDHKIIPISTTDNFWSMGDTGPCGPCSEIFYDHGEHIFGGPPGSPHENGDRFVEIWNLVFMQFEQLASGTRIDLPNPCIDTGMGLERIAAVLQGVHDNYETDIFQALMEQAADLLSVKISPENNPSFKVIADHLRSTSFLMADGVSPSNEGRGYVLRRIMRRAMRHAHMLGAKESLMWQLVGSLVSLMGGNYPELERAQPLIEETLHLEEERFRSTLGRGLKLLDQEVSTLGVDQQFPGNIAFKLYDTYGFPLDLTQDILRNKGLKVDISTFDACMKDQKEKARASWSGSGEDSVDAVWFNIREKQGLTEFLGYATEKAEGQVLALVIDGNQVDQLKTGQEGFVLMNQTPFYAESGGQAGDRGHMTGGNDLHLDVLEVVKKLDGLHVHRVKVLSGTVTKKSTMHMVVDHRRRLALKAHHSATHLLHAALRKTLGSSLTQKGSLVLPDRLRFDFNCPKALSQETLVQLEREVNAQIRLNTPVVTRLMSQEEAISNGAMALFGEKYDDEVRVVSMGEENDKSYSTELCGGTHVTQTGDIGFFKIVSEGSISAGVRRIEALAGEVAVSYVTTCENVLLATAELLKTTPAKLQERVNALLEEKKKLERDLANAKKNMLKGDDTKDQSTEIINGISVYIKVLEDVHPKDMRSIVDQLKQTFKSGVIALFSVRDGIVSVLVGVTQDLTSKWKENGKEGALVLQAHIALALGISSAGGGRPDMAQCGGGDPALILNAIEALKKTISSS